MARGQSIHIGLNSVDPDAYGGWAGELTACEFDADDMRAIAEDAGFAPTTLLTRDSTSEAVLEALQRSAAELESGDTLLLTYSGHGGQIPDTNADEADAQDETWVLYDRQLLDDELYAAYYSFATGVRIAVFSDSCHSGTVTRVGPPVPSGTTTSSVPIFEPGAVGARSRAMPAALAQRDFLRRRSVYEGVSHAGPPKGVESEADDAEACILLISGCQDNQLSLDGTHNGLFTATLLTVWNGGQFRGGYPQLRDQITARMPQTQTPKLTIVGTPNRQFLWNRPFSF